MFNFSEFIFQFLALSFFFELLHWGEDLIIYVGLFSVFTYIIWVVRQLVFFFLSLDIKVIYKIYKNIIYKNIFLHYSVIDILELVFIYFFFIINSEYIYKNIVLYKMIISEYNHFILTILPLINKIVKFLQPLRLWRREFPMFLFKKDLTLKLNNIFINIFKYNINFIFLC